MRLGEQSGGLSTGGEVEVEGGTAWRWEVRSVVISSGKRLAQVRGGGRR